MSKVGKKKEYVKEDVWVSGAPSGPERWVRESIRPQASIQPPSPT